ARVAPLPVRFRPTPPEAEIPWAVPPAPGTPPGPPTCVASQDPPIPPPPAHPARAAWVPPRPRGPATPPGRFPRTPPSEESRVEEAKPRWAVYSATSRADRTHPPRRRPDAPSRSRTPRCPAPSCPGRKSGPYLATAHPLPHRFPQD